MACQRLNRKGVLSTDEEEKVYGCSLPLAPVVSGSPWWSDVTPPSSSTSPPVVLSPVSGTLAKCKDSLRERILLSMWGSEGRVHESFGRAFPAMTRAMMRVGAMPYESIVSPQDFAGRVTHRDAVR